MGVAVPIEVPRLRALIEARLRGSTPGGDPMAHLVRGRTPEEVEAVRRLMPTEFSHAAVLVPIVDRPEGLTVLLTQRASHLKKHAGQISFPGGRVESGDEGPVEAALRETEEEIGLTRAHVRPIGYLRDHVVVSGYVVTPVVAFVRPGYTLAPDVSEVEDVFEVPLAFVLDPANRTPRELSFAGYRFAAEDIPYEGRNIWGATAAMLMSLSELLEDA